MRWEGQVSIALVMAVLLGAGRLQPAWSQDSRQNLPDTAEPEADMKPQSETQPREPRFLPPLLRPKALTPEEQEEAERLKKLAARYGTDPTAIVGRIQLSTEYADLPQGARATTSVVRVDVPFRSNWLLRVDVPFLKWSDPDRPGTTSAQGMSDLFAAVGWRLYNTYEYAFFIGAITSFPTASENSLSLDKYTVGPFIATARFVPRWESFLFGVFQHQTSVGGNPARADVERTRLSAIINTIWGRWWTLAQGVWQIDWERSAKSSMTLEFELGRALAGRWRIYGRPGVGIWGRDVIGAYDWNAEVGVRFMFASF